MVFADFLLALFLALVLTLVFALGFRRRNWKAQAVFYFLILFLATWAGGLWAPPIGPDWKGLFYIPFVVAGLVFALLLAVLMPPPRKIPPADSGVPEPRPGALFVTDVLFWVLVAALAVVIAAGYVLRLP